jgi:hypothetical protein
MIDKPCRICGAIPCEGVESPVMGYRGKRGWFIHCQCGAATGEWKTFEIAARKWNCDNEVIEGDVGL